ncbi:DUF2442 domain-containing protein [Clostridium oryzae]|uniref:DUF2442 domain-containing protein n=1 Tax=Clostridium oryzae TaxID=1450648 RepID=A0A1V4IEU9_9CLOT|nr:DUF2442 domain-containing protein [Clostridium oryzae]OPJ58456.1 hypothetical protein CLORY_36060 [Clostridium oryzae]
MSLNVPKVISVKPISQEYSLIVCFSNGITKKVSLLKKLDESVYENLKDKILFEQVQVDPGGYGISWNDDIDMSEYELWNIGEEITI